MKTTTKLLSMLIMLCAFNLNATNYFVTPTGSSSTSVPGTSWATAVSLKRAVNTLATADHGDVIYLAKGDYDVTASAFGAYVSLNKGGLTVIGGFAGTEPEGSIDPSQSTPSVNVTRFYGAAESKQYIFLIGAATSTQTTTIKNINFEDMYSTSTKNIQTLVFYSNAASTIPYVVDGCNFRRLTLTSNSASSATVMYYTSIQANLTIQNCSFSNLVCNSITTTLAATSINSGVLKLGITKTPTTSVEIKNCNINNNSVTGYNSATSAAIPGNAGFIFTNATTRTNVNDKGYYKVTDCLIDNCAATGIGGFLYAGQGQTWTFSGSVLKNCTSGSYGGAIHMAGGTIVASPASNTTDSLSIVNSCIVSNTSAATKQAVSYATSTGNAVTISRSIITNNSNGAGSTTLRDILDPTSSGTTVVTYGATESLLNGGFVSSASNSYRGATTYNDYLTSTQLQTITNASTLSNAIAAGQTLIDQAKLATQDIHSVNYSNLQFSMHGKTLELATVVDEIDIYSISGSLISKVSNAGNISLTGIPHGIYLVKAIQSGSNALAKIAI
ncbi:MAG: hypothetical protein WCK78_01830 [Paludibacter sp.]